MSNTPIPAKRFLYKSQLSLRRLFLFPAFGLFFLLGCSDVSAPVEDERSAREQLLDQLTSEQRADFDALIAPPSSAELEAIREEWQSRDLTPGVVEQMDSSSLAVGFGSSAQQFPLIIYSHTQEGFVHYSAVVVPPSDEPLPVLLFCHGGDEGVDVSLVGTALFALPEVAQNFIIVIPSFRAEPLSQGDSAWLSGGAPSPWDRDVDDVLRALAALDSLPGIEYDAQRILALGFSRGSTVAMLAAVRDPRIQGVVNYFGPADFLAEFSQEEILLSLVGTPNDKPGVVHLQDTYLEAYFAGELPLAQVRTALIRRSPAWFVESLPPLQIHHGSADDVVHISESERLWDALEEFAPETAARSQYFPYEGGGHNPLQLQGSVTRVQEFLMGF